MFREEILAYSKGDNLRGFWFLFKLREQAGNRLVRDLLTFLCNRSAHRHGGYIGKGAKMDGIPSLPHGLHGIYISRYASIGSDCRIYQNVTIGEVNRKAPRVGNCCLIGAGATVVGDIQIGNNVRIGAGAVVSFDVPDNCTVVSPKARLLDRKSEGREEHEISSGKGVDRA